MTWLFVAITGYFLNAVANILDKHILVSQIQKPAVYAFFVSIFSLVALVFAPFGFSLSLEKSVAFALVAGFLFTYSLLFLYKAVKENEISRIAPLVGMVSALTSLVIAFALQSVSGLIFSKEILFAFWFLVAGGFLIAFDLPLQKSWFAKGVGSAIVSGVFSAFYFTILRYSYAPGAFVNAFLWSKIGIFIGGISLLFVTSYRKAIIESLHSSADSVAQKKERTTAIYWFLVNKVAGTTGNLAVNYAVSIGPLVLIEALGGIQFAFVLVLAGVVSLYRSHTLREHLSFGDWFQRIVALTFIGLGIYFSAISNITFFAL